jgi:hypothetical protein
LTTDRTSFAAELRKRKLLAIRAIFTGWGTLLILALVERPVLSIGYRLIGGPLWPSLAPVIDCLVFAASGWIVGRLHRDIHGSAVFLFLVSLLPFDLRPLLPLDVPFAAKSILNAFGDSRYASGVFATILNNGILLVSVWIGGSLSRPTQPRPSIAP